MNARAPAAVARRPVLDVKGLSKGFTLHLRGGAQLPVLENLDLQVHAGECVALVGASGRGKSTLIKCLYGSYAADAGSIVFYGDAGVHDLAAATPHQWMLLRRREIAYVSQFLRVVPRVPALDLVAERILDAHGVMAESDEAAFAAAWEAARSRSAELLQRLNLPPALWSLPPATFSGGEQQRVNIARGFIEPSRLLLLDEPTASLDAHNRRIVIALIHEALTRGCAVVGIFHDEEVREAVATRRISWEPLT
jgi:alpha-D-ribose 1-methylphosphonate 5-triphosphate synthase subunit PhnL